MSASVDASQSLPPAWEMILEVADEWHALRSRERAPSGQEAGPADLLEVVAMLGGLRDTPGELRERIRRIRGTLPDDDLDYLVRLGIAANRRPATK